MIPERFPHKLEFYKSQEPNLLARDSLPWVPRCSTVSGKSNPIPVFQSVLAAGSGFAGLLEIHGGRFKQGLQFRVGFTLQRHF